MTGIERNRIFKAIENNEYKRELLKEIYVTTILEAINQDEKIKKQIVKFIKGMK